MQGRVNVKRGFPSFWGDGSDGILTAGATYPVEKYSAFCIKQFSSINWDPAGPETLTVNQPCRGFILLVDGDVSIGQYATISMAKKGSALPCNPEELLLSFGASRQIKHIVERLVALSGGNGGNGGKAQSDSGGVSGTPGVGGPGRICQGGFGGGGAGGRSNASGTGGDGGSIILPDILGRGSKYKGNPGIQGGGGYWHNNATGYNSGGDPYGAGGSGGSKGGHGANGEHSGGFILIVAKGNVSITGGLNASGGNGGSAPSDIRGGPGGGSGGGVIALFAKGSIDTSSATINLAGGLPGTPAYTAGTAGGPGTYYEEQLSV